MHMISTRTRLSSRPHLLQPGEVLGKTHCRLGRQQTIVCACCTRGLSNIRPACLKLCKTCFTLKHICSDADWLARHVTLIEAALSPHGILPCAYADRPATTTGKRCFPTVSAASAALICTTSFSSVCLSDRVQQHRPLIAVSVGDKHLPSLPMCCFCCELDTVRGASYSDCSLLSVHTINVCSRCHSNANALVSLCIELHA